MATSRRYLVTKTDQTIQEGPGYKLESKANRFEIVDKTTLEQAHGVRAGKTILDPFTYVSNEVAEKLVQLWPEMWSIEEMEEPNQ